MFGCIFIPDFLVQAGIFFEFEDRRQQLKISPIAILEGPPALLRVTAINSMARQYGIAIGMTKVQVETCGGVALLNRSPKNEQAAQAALLDCASAFSPRVESFSPGIVLLDLHGTEKLFGSWSCIAQKITQRAQDFGFDVNVALALNPDTAMFAARGFSGITFIPFGQEAQRLATLPVNVLDAEEEIRNTLQGWGIHNLGSLAALPSIALSERLGQEGLRLQSLARAGTMRTLVPVGPSSNFIESVEFENPVETLESLTFILNRLLLQICSRLESHSLATNELHLQLELEARQRQTGATKENYERIWKLPFPSIDAKVLLRLVCLDLDAVSFSAPIRKLTVEAHPVKPRSAQGGLFAPASPQPEQMEITLSRIRGVVGAVDETDTACVGSPQTLDSYKPDSFTVLPFPIESSKSVVDRANTIIAFRIFRPALETTVEFSDQPRSVALGKRRCRVVTASGPWRGSGQWWDEKSTWSREEWDVVLNTPDGSGFYRIYRDDLIQKWFVEGVFD